MTFFISKLSEQKIIAWIRLRKRILHSFCTQEMFNLLMFEFICGWMLHLFKFVRLCSCLPFRKCGIVGECDLSVGLYCWIVKRSSTVYLNVFRFHPILKLLVSVCVWCAQPMKQHTIGIISFSNKSISFLFIVNYFTRTRINIWWS